MDNERQPWTVLFLTSILLVALPPCSAAQTSPETSWNGTWATSPVQVDIHRSFIRQTLRQIIHTSIPGSDARIQISNLFGTQPLRIEDAHLAIRGDGSSILPATDHPILFGGQTSVTVPSGATIASDPVAITIPAFSDVAVSMYLPGPTESPTFHPYAHQTSYIAPADVSGDTELPNALATESSYFITNFDVHGEGLHGTVVTLGASITEGFISADNANHRWPDLLAQRLAGAGLTIGVLNEGIAGNRLLISGAGPSAESRFDRDVLKQPGALWVILSDDPINDLNSAQPLPTSADLVSGIQGLISKAHAKNIRFFCSTLTPYEGADHWTAAGETAREQVNAFLRSKTSGCDAVIDQDAATHDPTHPTRYLPAYDAGDHIHPNDAGLKAIANSVDLALFRATLCRVQPKMKIYRLCFNSCFLIGLCSKLSIFLLAAAFASRMSGQDQSTTQPKITAHAVSKNSEYVGSQVCGKCHVDIYQQYIKTGMGRSMSSISPSLVESLHLPAEHYDRNLDRHYDISTRDGKLFESEFAVDASGKEIFRDEHQLQWIIGSGANATGAIIQRDEYLFEAPLSLYTKTMTWEPSPGYEFADLGFSRPILAGCVSCHSGLPNPVSGSSGRFESPVFTEMAIGCEKCHGPGATHLQAVASAASYKKKNFSIVNPSQLSPELANNICMACHEIGDERILKPGKDYRDIRPGDPLDNTLSIFLVPPSRQSPPQKDHLQHYYSMTLSKCYRASGRRLRCISCHDPHIEPPRQEAPTYFDKKCLNCHTDQSCKLSQQARQQSQPKDDCIGCHMPKREVGSIVHSSLTNHRIIAQSDESFPDEAFAQTTELLPDLIHLNPVPGYKDVNPPLLTLFQAYGELAAYKTEYVTPYRKVLDQLQQTEPNNVLVQAALGREYLQSGHYQEAIAHLERSLKISPPLAAVYSDLSEALDKTGDREQGLAMLEKAIHLEPFNPLFQRSLVFRLIDLKQLSRAQTAMDWYLQIFPQDSFARQKFAIAMGSAMK